MGHQACGALELWNYPMWLRNIVHQNIDGTDRPDHVGVASLDKVAVADVIAAVAAVVMIDSGWSGRGNGGAHGVAVRWEEVVLMMVLLREGSVVVTRLGWPESRRKRYGSAGIYERKEEKILVLG
nr:heme peroxidase [Tanacetum cinerariifolium]GEX26354.1 heme peroxidase [Tanacetum cinerariifolium]